MKLNLLTIGIITLVAIGTGFLILNKPAGDSFQLQSKTTKPQPVTSLQNDPKHIEPQGIAAIEKLDIISRANESEKEKGENFYTQEELDYYLSKTQQFENSYHARESFHPANKTQGILNHLIDSDSTAQAILAYRYKMGYTDDTKSSLQKALVWAKVAAANGDEYALMLIPQILLDMGQEHKIEALAYYKLGLYKKNILSKVAYYRQAESWNQEQQVKAEDLLVYKNLEQRLMAYQNKTKQEICQQMGYCSNNRK